MKFLRNTITLATGLFVGSARFRAGVCSSVNLEPSRKPVVNDLVLKSC